MPARRPSILAELEFFLLRAGKTQLGALRPEPLRLGEAPKLSFFQVGEKTIRKEFK